MPAGTITGFVRELAARRPDAVAAIDHGRVVTYAELDRRAGRMAAWLAHQGLHPGDMAGITVRAPLPHLVTTLALMRLGCDQIGLASQDTASMRADLAARTRAVAVIGERPEDAIEGVGLIMPDHEAIAADAALGAPPEPGRGADGTTVLLTSSGTTGRPKLIPLSERLLRVRAGLLPYVGERRLMPVAVEFPQSRRSFITTLAGGGSTVFATSGEGLHLIEALRRFAVDHVTLAPSRAETLVQEAARGEGPGAWPERTRLTVTGAPVPGELRRRIQAHLTHNLHVSYGATECGYISLARPDDHALHPDGVGRAQSAEVIVTTAEGTPLPPGQAGFVRVRSAGTVPGYLDDPEANARTFLPGGWYQPGDIASITPDGHVLLAGRGDDMMILGTINVFPAEIERAAEGFPGLADCAAFAYRSGAQGDIPMIAAVETAPGALDRAALMAHCRARLGLRAPRKAIIVQALPRNAAGKVLRRELATIATAEIRPS